MKHLLKNLVFLLLISMSAFSQDGKFTFTISSSATTSAGVFKTDGTLVRTLWNNVKYASGTYTESWDGKDDNGATISSPSANYQVKILTNNVQYAWQGTIGNSSTNMTGTSKHRGYYTCMSGLVFASNGYGYYCNGFSEGNASYYKFHKDKPQEKLDFFTNFTGRILTLNTEYVATDDKNVYWAGFDSYANTNSMVHAIRTSDDATVVFPSGSSYTVTNGEVTYQSVISKMNATNSKISGLAVQQNGNYLFVARSGLNKLYVLNKTTGALVQSLTITTPRGLNVDGNDNLWMISGTKTVAKYTVNTNGTLTSATLSIPGLLEPLAVQVSNDGSTVTIADGGANQQVKAFSNTTGAASWTLGTAGGYFNDATVTNGKFYFSDVQGYNHKYRPVFLAYQADGSFWVGDGGNWRAQHYSSNRTYIDGIASLGSTYTTNVDKNNINRVFAEYLEFQVDYSVQSLTGSTGWTLKKNWGANVSSNYDVFQKIKYQTTLSNGRTYGFLKTPNGLWEVVELPLTGQLRFTGKLVSRFGLLCSDGSLQDYVTSTKTSTYRKHALTGFDGSNNPTWSATGELLAMADVDKVKGNPVQEPITQIFSSTDKVVLYNYKAYSNNSGPVFSTGYHLGVMKKGANNTYLAQTEASTHRDYHGSYPQPGWFDCGNNVNDYGGGNVNIIDRNIITSYHGEFWKNGQTNKYNHYYDNGLAIGQFGTTRAEVPGVGGLNSAAAMMAGNALSPTLVKDGNGDMYLWHGDESDHAGVHRWKITGLNTIAEQTVTIAFPSAFASPVINYTDLMANLPFNATLSNNTVGWTRNPVNEIVGDPYNNIWNVHTNGLRFDKKGSHDLYIKFAQPAVQTFSLNRDLGTNNVTNSWKVTGNVAFAESGGTINGMNGNSYLEVLDDQGLVLTTFYVVADKSAYPIVFTKLYGNTVPVFSLSSGTAVVTKPNAFEISIMNGQVSFLYAGFAPITTTISNSNGNWKKPKTLRIKFQSTGTSNYPVFYDVSDLKFYKDYSAVALPNQPPVADAGGDLYITFPTVSANLAGSGTDPDGSIVSYSWVKVSGPTTGLISSPTTAATSIISLVPGVYQYQLTVTDNKGLTDRDTVKVTVNAAGANLMPITSAGLDIVLTWPSNSVTLTGFGTDPDGIVESYAWSVVGGPASRSITAVNGAITVVNNLVPGIYLFELLVTDNDGGIGRDTVQVTINSVPVANAGGNRITTLPLNSITLAGSGTDTDGTISSYSWAKISGPSYGTIASATSASTVINGLAAGIYQFELTVKDNFGAVGKDVMQLIVNVAPVANAGNPIIVTYPASQATLNGSATDVDGTIVSYNWVKLSGPASGTIATPGAATSAVTNLVQGNYKFVLTVTDNNGAIGKDTVEVGSNLMPTASAGIDKVLIIPTSTATLSGSGTDPDGTISTYSWAKISGPSSGAVSWSTKGVTPITALVQGVYKFELTVTDNSGATDTDTIQVAVTVAPLANAGVSDTITLPVNSITLNGVGTDADGYIASYSWVKTTGSTTGTIETPNAATTRIINMIPGKYSFELTVTDNYGITAKSVTQVTVNQPPVSYAGLDKAFTLPVNSTTLAGGGADPDGIIISYAWSKVAGPSSVTIEKPTQLSTKISNLVQGIYKFELAVKDNMGIIDRDTVQVIVNKSPTAFAGSNKAITLPLNTTTISGSGTDTDGTITTYAWRNLSGSSSMSIATASAATTSLVNLVQGVYVYELTVTDNIGATGRDTVQVTVNRAGTATKTVNNAGPVTTAVTSVIGSESNLNHSKTAVVNQLKVFPNPVRDIANLSITTNGKSNKVSVSMYNSLGMLVNFKELTTTQINTILKLDLSKLNNGAYSVILRFEDGQKISNMIIKD